MKYLDFDLAIERASDGYAARVFNSPAGQAATEFRLPFSDLELENLLLRISRSRQTLSRRVASSELAAAKSFGGRLFESVFDGDVRGCFRSSVDESQRQECGLRVRLHLSKTPELADLPWEYLYNSNLNRFLGLSIETPVVRYLDFAERIRPLAVRPPLRILLMISSPTDHPQLDVMREVAKMEEALADLQARGLVQVERQEDATLAELQRRLRARDYHVFHFVGHGGFDREIQDGFLLLEDAQNRGRKVGAQYIGTVLRDHRPLRLALLNACEGARGSVTDPFAGTAQSLVQQGIPAVIAMQFEFTDESAICFTHEFYASLAAGYPVDAAITEARKAIFAQGNEVEWGTPVLYMRSQDGRIFDVERSQDVEQRPASAVRDPVDSDTAVSRAAATASAAAAPALNDARSVPGRQKAAAQRPRPPQAAEQRPAASRPEQRLQVRVNHEPATRPGTSMQQRSVLAAFVLTMLVGLMLVGLSPRTQSATDVAAGTDPARDRHGNDTQRGLEPTAAQPPPNQPAVQPTAAATDAKPGTTQSETRATHEQTGIRSVLARAALAETTAFRTLDASALEQVYTGEALDSYKARLRQLTVEGRYEIHKLQRQSIDTVAVFDAGRARTHFTEVWNAAIYDRKSRQCLAYYRDYAVSQSALLKLAPSGWQIYSLKASSAAPAAGPCP